MSLSGHSSIFTLSFSPLSHSLSLIPVWEPHQLWVDGIRNVCLWYHFSPSYLPFHISFSKLNLQLHNCHLLMLPSTCFIPHLVPLFFPSFLCLLHTHTLPHSHTLKYALLRPFVRLSFSPRCHSISNAREVRLLEHSGFNLAASPPRHGLPIMSPCGWNGRRVL